MIHHTHTQFCDGDNSPEEIAQEAIRLGCPEVGFSGHLVPQILAPSVKYC